MIQKWGLRLIPDRGDQLRLFLLLANEFIVNAVTWPHGSMTSLPWHHDSPPKSDVSDVPMCSSSYSGPLFISWLEILFLTHPSILPPHPSIQLK